MKPFKRHRFWGALGFSRQLLIIAVGSFVISSILISAIILQLVDRQSREILLAQQGEISAMVASRIDNSLEERQKLLEMFTQQLVVDDQLRPTTELQSLLDNRRSLHHFFNGGRVLLNKAGRSIIDSPIVPGRSGIDFSDRPHVKRAHSTKSTVITQPLIGRGLKSPVFVINTPILNSQREVVGFLFGVTQLASDNLFRQIGREMLGQSASHMVIEPNLEIIITASRPELAMQSIHDSEMI
ncbi:MAG: cache domain-containing protein, partial [Planctomycetes bacterium]|nr:cache domain-containing protein [Planctomycetota bacterium]